MPSILDWNWSVQTSGKSTGGSSGASHKMQYRLELVLRDGTFLSISESVGVKDVERVNVTGRKIAAILGVPYQPPAP